MIIAWKYKNLLRLRFIITRYYRSLYPARRLTASLNNARLLRQNATKRMYNVHVCSSDVTDRAIYKAQAGKSAVQ